MYDERRKKSIGIKMYFQFLRNEDICEMYEAELLAKIKQLEYHQTLLLYMMKNSNDDFYKLVITYSLSEEEVAAFYDVCEKMNKELENQKAEGLLYFHPLFEQFKASLSAKVNPREVIHACISQQLFLPLMKELTKYL